MILREQVLAYKYSIEILKQDKHPDFLAVSPRTFPFLNLLLEILSVKLYLSLNPFNLVFALISIMNAVYLNIHYLND